MMSKMEHDLVKLVFVHPGGKRETVEDQIGKSVMDFAVDHGVKGIEAQCGGACICTTCMCHFSESLFRKLPPADEDELEMLSYAPKRRKTSRLACQIRVSNQLQGFEVLVDYEK